jgi:hygromycin-B 7''-O-kinase
MTLSSYSTRLGYLIPEQFQKAVERFGLGNFIKAEPIPYGLFGQNVFLTSSKGEYVLRGAPHSSWQFPTECFFTNLLHRHTKTPVPYPYLIETSTDVFGWSYVIMPRLPGITLQDPTIKQRLSIEDRLEIARAVAKMLIEIQTLTWDCCGSYQAEADRVEPFMINYRERVVQNIREKLEASCSQ